MSLGSPACAADTPAAQTLSESSPSSVRSRRRGVVRSEDDWRRVKDPKEKKRIQNRVAQRTYRHRMKARLGELQARLDSHERRHVHDEGDSPSAASDKTEASGILNKMEGSGILDKMEASIVGSFSSMLADEKPNMTDHKDGGFLGVLSGTGDNDFVLDCLRFQNHLLSRLSGVQACAAEALTPAPSDLESAIWHLPCVSPAFLLPAAAMPHPAMSPAQSTISSGHASTLNIPLDNSPLFDGSNSLNSDGSNSLTSTMSTPLSNYTLPPTPSVSSPLSNTTPCLSLNNPAPLSINGNTSPLSTYNTCPLSIDTNTSPLSIDTNTCPLSIDNNTCPLSLNASNSPLSITTNTSPLSIDTNTSPLSTDNNTSPLSINTTSPLSPNPSLGPIIATLLHHIQSAGFETFDHLVASYYCTNLDAAPFAAQHQHASRTRRLPRVLADVFRAAAHWTAWERRGFHDEVLRMAEALLRAERSDVCLFMP